MSSVLAPKLLQVGKFCLSLFIICMVIGGCASRKKPKLTTYKTSPEIPQEVKLTEDRKFLDKEREKLPEQIKQENDEIAFILQLMNSEYQLAPWEIRQKFDKAMRDKQNKFSKILRTDREAFSKDERKKNADFLKMQKQARTKFQKKRSHPTSETQEFYSQLEQERRDFFSAQNEKRREFESTIQEKRTNFESYMREKRSQFDLTYREYSRGHYEFQKTKREQRQVPAPANNTVPLAPNSTGD